MVFAIRQGEPVEFAAGGSVSVHKFELVCLAVKNSDDIAFGPYYRFPVRGYGCFGVQRRSACRKLHGNALGRNRTLIFLFRA